MAIVTTLSARLTYVSEVRDAVDAGTYLQISDISGRLTRQYEPNFKDVKRIVTTLKMFDIRTVHTHIERPLPFVQYPYLNSQYSSTILGGVQDVIDVYLAAKYKSTLEENAMQTMHHCSPKLTFVCQVRNGIAKGCQFRVRTTKGVVNYYPEHLSDKNILRDLATYEIRIVYPEPQEEITMQIIKTMETLATATREGKTIEHCTPRTGMVSEWRTIIVDSFNYGTMRRYIEAGHIRIKQEPVELLVANYLSSNDCLHRIMFNDTREENLRNFHEFNHAHNVRWSNLTDRATGNIIRHYYSNPNVSIGPAAGVATGGCRCSNCGSNCGGDNCGCARGGRGS